MKKCKVIENLIITAVIIISLLWIGSIKYGFHIDEIWTFHLANYQYNDTLGIANFDIVDGRSYTGETLWDNYMTVQPEHRFDYKNVWVNQAADVHPPLYYCLIHTICSFFPNQCEAWMGLILNVLLAAVIFWQVRWMFERFLKDEKCSNIISFIFMFSVGFINAISFFRMYVLLMVWTNALVILLLDDCDRNNSWKFYGKLYLIIFGGMMTQYYYSIFTCFICAIYAVYVWKDKNYKKILLSTLTIASSVMTEIVIFPAMLKHIFWSGRGKEAFSNIHADGFMEHLFQFLKIINVQLFGGLIIIVLFIALFILVMGGHINRNIELTKIFMKKYLLVLFPTIIYILFIAKLAPYRDIRYLMNILALVYVLIASLIYYTLKNVVGLKAGAASIILLLLIIIGYKTGIPNFRLSEKENVVQLEKMKDVPCVYLYDEKYKWNIAANILELRKLDEISFFELNSDDITINDKAIVYVMRGSDDETVLSKLMKYNTHLTKKEKLFQSGYSTVYYLN